jgi:uncharacterized metal-binding protein YceD (DUF177 family)
MAKTGTGNEFSRPLAVKDIGDRPLERHIEAKPAERDALARRFGLLGLDSLAADLTLSWRGAEVIVEGTLRADVVQRCVVTLAEVPAAVTSDFTLVYRENAASGAQPEEDIDPDSEEELPEPFGPEGIDLGEAVAQQLALALDPYPRHPQAALDKTEWGRPLSDEEAEGARNSPFAVLKNLKRER